MLLAENLAFRLPIHPRLVPLRRSHGHNASDWNILREFRRGLLCAHLGDYHIPTPKCKEHAADLFSRRTDS